MSTFVLLIVIAMILAIVALVKPAWPLTPVGLLLVCVALLIGKNMKWLLLILVVCAGCYTPPKAKRLGAAVPATVTLGWSASPSPEVTGYVLYYRSATTTNRVDVGASLTNTVTSLVAGTTYTFHATAYNSDLVESVPSNSVDYTPSLPPLPPQNLHIVITPQTSDSLNGPWLAVESWPALTLTNPVGQRFYRYDITKGNP